jgi:hypothetical protein
MSEQQVRLSDKQAMACKITKFSTFIGDWSAFGCCCEKKEKKVKKSYA